MHNDQTDDLKLICASKYFDAAYYYAARPDVLAAGVDAALHYLNQGWKEGANPGPNFNTNMYLAYNSVNRCPLVDYIRRGSHGDYSGSGAPKQQIRRYRRQKWFRRARTACYTFVSRGYDKLLSHNYIVPEWDYICFTDDPELLKQKYVGIWRIKRAKFSKLDSKRNSGWHKTHPEVCCGKYKQSVWIDVNVNILSNYLKQEILSRDTDLLVPLHYSRDCIFQEVYAVIDAGRDTVQACMDTEKFLQDENMPAHYGLNETNIMFRRHNAPTVRAIDALWWDCICRYSKRDQLSFSYALFRNGVYPADIAINNTRTDHRNFLVRDHTLCGGPMLKKYDIIYSIGRDCACSFYLQTNGLRACSGPMDWITTANFKQRFEMLLNDFVDFMNPECFEFLPKNPNVFNDEKCDYYRNTKTGFDFYHDFPTGVPFSESFPAVAEKYQRRIARFYKNIRENKRVLLVWFSHYTTTPDDVVISLCERFCKKMRKNIDFLIIEHKENQNIPQKVQLRPNITRWSLHTWARDENGTVMVNGNEKLVNPIFAEYSLQPVDYSHDMGFWNWLHFRVLCGLIPVAKWRRNARRHVRRKLHPEQNQVLQVPPSTTQSSNMPDAVQNTLDKQLLAKECPEQQLPQLLYDRFFLYTGKHPSDELVTLNEKIMWAQMFNATDLKTKLADKYTVRDYVSDKIGDKYLTKLYGVWDDADQIDFTSLPDKYVLKFSEGSGKVLLVPNKNNLNMEHAKQQIINWQNNPFWIMACEMQYKNSAKKIIAEEFINTKIEYKLWMFHGKCKFIKIEIMNEFAENGKPDNQFGKFFYPDWTPADFRTIGDEPNFEIQRPDQLPELIQISEILAQPFDFVRVDFFETNTGKLVFGEMTFSPAGGNIHFEPASKNTEFGKLLTLPPRDENGFAIR